MLPQVTPRYGRCIYCSYDGPADKLSDEHTIPKSLDGKRQLLLASCPKCCDVTKALEGYVSGKMLGTFRTARGVYTRHKKNRRLEAIQRVRLRGELEDVVLRIKDEHTAPLFLPHLPLPGILDGDDLSDRWECHEYGIWVRNLNTTKLPAGRIRVHASGDLDAYRFGRVIAKIAHCEAVNLFGLENFEPFLPAIILGTSTAVPYFVGCIPGRHDPLPVSDRNWILSLLQHNDEQLIIHVIRLFGDIVLGRQPVGTPYFMSVVGRLNPWRNGSEVVPLYSTLDKLVKETLLGFRRASNISHLGHGGHPPVT
jgi:hypothetical protein